MKKLLFFLILSFWSSMTLCAQAPSITYPNSNIIVVGTPITPIYPSNTGGAINPIIYGKVSTFAGAPPTYFSPLAVAVDRAGNIYVASEVGNKIQKINSSGVVTTLAGSDTVGSANGTGTAASFYIPKGVAVDAVGNVYVADKWNHKIRKITAAGVVTTFAGSGVAGSLNATGTAAKFNAPNSVAVDGSGNLYVADTDNNIIRKITAAGVVTTLAGSGVASSTNGTGTAASFNNPFGIAVDLTGNVYVAEYYGNQIRKITSAGVVTTLAGSGALGSANGTGTAASFFYPSGVAVDGTGNVYVADTNNFKIRKITADGVVTTFAGNAAAGSADGIGTAATFSSPIGVAVDPAGNVYVADRGNNIIRKITAAGLVSTLKGNTTNGSADGKGTTASSYYPSGVAFDAAGNVFVASGIGHKIQKITSAGVVTTLAGSETIGSADGTGTTAGFNYPSGVAVDGAGNVYVADKGNHKIRKITSAGIVTTLAGSTVIGSADGTGSAATFNGPTGLIVDTAGNVYVADALNNNIRKITSSGVVTTIAGNGIAGSLNGIGTAASFNDPSGIAIDAAGNLYIADTGNNKIRKITTAGAVTTLAGSGTVGSDNGAGTTASFNYPFGLTVDSTGNVYVADYWGNLIRKITSAGVVTTFAGTGFIGSADDIGAFATFSSPAGVAVDGTGTVYVADRTNDKVRKITSAAVVTTLARNVSINSADGIGTAALFNSPSGIAVDGAGNLYVADTDNQKIRKISPAGIVTKLAGSGSYCLGPNGGPITLADGTGTSARFNSPFGIAVDGQGNVYVADTWGNQIRKITPTGDVTTLAGSGVKGSADGTGTAATFNYPYGVAVDILGNVYVGDTGNYKIRKITPTGVVTSLAGTGSWGFGDGTGAAAGFKSPIGLAVDIAGNVYVADNGNSQIRKISPAGVVTTFAGSGVSNPTSGSSSAPNVFYPYGISIDAAGNLYVSDNSTHLILKITSAGVVTTLAGSYAAGLVNATGTAAYFNSPKGVAVDAGGNVFVADSKNNAIRKITIASYSINPPIGSGLLFNTTTGAISGTPTSAKVASTAPNPTAKNNSVTSYKVTAYNEFGNSSTIVNITVGSLSTSSFEVSNNLKIYPIPASSSITIELKNLDNVILEVFDITGKEVMTQNLNVSSNIINIEKLPSGIYLFKINTDQGSATSKVVKN